MSSALNTMAQCLVQITPKDVEMAQVEGTPSADLIAAVIREKVDLEQSQPVQINEPNQSVTGATTQLILHGDGLSL